MRTGKVDFGQTTAHTAYKQIVAEELNVPYEAITGVVMGDTDRTPDGGFSAGFLEYGGTNLRKAAAYTYQALLELAATSLGVPKEQLSVKDGVIAGGGKRDRLRRTGARAGTEADDPGRGRPDRPVRPDRHRHAADEADQRLHDHRPLVRQHRDPVEGDGQGDSGSPTCVCRACCTGASSTRRRSARRSSPPVRSTRRGSERARGREGQPGRRRRAQRVGGDPGARSRSPRPPRGPTGRGCPATTGSTRGCGTRPTGRPRRSPGARRARAR